MPTSKDGRWGVRADKLTSIEAVALRVHGVVQGVGFRPFVYRLARQMGLSGWVRNDVCGVAIHVEGHPRRVERFCAGLARRAPSGARVSGLERSPAVPTGQTDFYIGPSADEDGEASEGLRVPTDRATCPACRREVFDPTNRRHLYPFTNCTSCGPRYSIVRYLPYDRSATSMSTFALCADCCGEYDAPVDRRFHAEPVACAVCGPKVTLKGADGRELASGPEAVTVAAQRLRAGEIVALKGLGGFQLLVRADDAAAVRRLRERKARPTKPLAVMVGDARLAARLVRLGPADRRLLRSPENPIVLLERRPGADRFLAPEVAPRLRWIGVLLPTTPLHHLLLSELDLVLVCTSGNRGDEPIVTEVREAVARLAGIADLYLVHNRPILRRVDDAVVRPTFGGTVTLRLARGHAPLPLPALEQWAARHRLTSAGVLAVGGQQKSALAMWTGTQAVLGPHVGDLDGPDTRAAFERLTRELPELYRCAFGAVAHDLHPDYFSTRWAMDQGWTTVAVQHHHAHAVAVMVEHDLLDEEVLAFTWDGTGCGPDGTVWGGEVLRARMNRFERVASLRPFALPGGEQAIREPARVALALVAEALGAEAVNADADLPGRLGMNATTTRTLLRMATRSVNAPVTSSIGRLFDGIAALLIGAKRVSYEGEAAAWLESISSEAAVDGYPLPLVDSECGVPRGDWRPLIRAVLADVRGGVDRAVVSARFHQSLADWAAAVARRHAQLPVVVGGGCFQNRLLLERVVAILQTSGRRVYHPCRIPPNDGGLAAGQLAVGMTARLV
jgi:hydrogenase maturation protein HypF